MDKRRLGGASRAVVGSIKDAIGKVTGDTRLEAEGVADRTIGSTLKKVGTENEAARELAGK